MPSSRQSLEPASAKDKAADFTLSVLEESFLDGTGAVGFELDTQYVGNEIIVNIQVTGAHGLNALYCDVAYDPEYYTPIAAEPTAAMGAVDDLLSIAVLHDRGVVHYGQLIPHAAERDRFNGDGVLARVKFSSSKAPQGRVTCSVPVSDSAQVALSSSGGMLSWYYTNIGDYDQNGVVAISDMTPLGKYLGEVAKYDQFPGYSNLYVVDGDGNGEINVADFTFIGVNYGASVLGGYGIYASINSADYPSTNSSPNGDGAMQVGHVDLKNDATGNPATQHLHFQVILEDPQEGMYYWVRPLDEEGNEGTPSTLPEPLEFIVPVYHYCETLASWDNETGSLFWWYYNCGDLNQDGRVLVNDIYVIGQHYMKTGPFEYNSALSVVDADQNSEINITDLNYIAMHLCNVVDGYNIYASDDPLDCPSDCNGESTITPIAFISFREAQGDPDVDRLWFNYLEQHPPKQYYWVRPVHKGEEGTRSNRVDGPE